MYDFFVFVFFFVFFAFTSFIFFIYNNISNHMTVLSIPSKALNSSCSSGDEQFPIIIKRPCAITRLTAHFMCGLMSDLVTFKCMGIRKVILASYQNVCQRLRSLYLQYTFQVYLLKELVVYNYTINMFMSLK